MNIEMTWRQHEITMFARLPSPSLDAAEVGTLVTRLASAWANVWSKQQSISCRSGCAACCRQMVPVSEPEMHHLERTLESLAPEHRERVQHRFATTIAQLESTGLAERLRTPPTTDEAYIELMRDYFRLGAACPFLEDELCSIYDDRPSICREYAVSSLPAWCNTPFSAQVRVVPTGLNMVQLAQEAWKSLGHGPFKVTVLPLALQWLEGDGQELPAVDGKKFLTAMFDAAPRTLRPWLRAMPSTKPQPARPTVEIWRGAS